MKKIRGTSLNPSKVTNTIWFEWNKLGHIKWDSPLCKDKKDETN